MLASARSPLPWLGALLAIYLAYPIVAFLVELARHHAGAFSAPGLWSAAEVSLVTASVTALICAVFGVPLAYVLAHSSRRFAAVVSAAAYLPLALPPLMAGIVLISVFGPNTAVGSAFGGRLTDSMAGIVIAQTFVSAPFTIIASRSAFGAIDPSFDDVAATLGLGRVRRFLTVALPIASRAIGAGLLLTWMRAFGEFGATVIVAYHPYSLPVYTYVRFGGFGLASASGPAALALGAAVVVVAITRIRLPQRGVARSTVSPAPPRATPAPDPLRFTIDHRLGEFHLDLAYASRSRHLAILGSSGAGKTTALRCLAGLAGEHAASVRLGERVVSTAPPESRRVAYVPQLPTLLPHQDVWRQVTLGANAQPSLAAYWIEELGLAEYVARIPEKLSGGQQHRVALCRALATDPEIMLLDEPFTALDAPVRMDARRALRALQRNGGFVSVLVTHDPEEAAYLADEILVIDHGGLLQAGSVSELFARPSSPHVARILGIVNVNVGRVVSPGRIETAGFVVESEDAAGVDPGTLVAWCVRPERVVLRRSLAGDEGGVATVTDVADLGWVRELRVRVGDGFELVTRTNDQATPPVGERCAIEIEPEAVVAWRAGSLAQPEMSGLECFGGEEKKAQAIGTTGWTIA
ncbi:MAG: ATP-binding cassette domain-containing protein [Acidimicrobiales bacterium]